MALINLKKDAQEQTGILKDHNPATLRGKFALAVLPDGWEEMNAEIAGNPVPCYYIPAPEARAVVVAVNGLHSSPLVNVESYKKFTEQNISVIGVALIPENNHTSYVAKNRAMVEQFLLNPDSPVFKIAPELPHILMTHSSSGLFSLDALTEENNIEAAQTLYQGALHLTPFLEGRRASPEYNPLSSRLYQIFSRINQDEPVLESWIEKLVFKWQGRIITAEDKEFCYGLPRHGHIAALQNHARDFRAKLFTGARPAIGSETFLSFDQKIILSADDNKVCNQTVRDVAQILGLPVEIHAGRHSTSLIENDSWNAILRFVNEHTPPPIPKPEHRKEPLSARSAFRRLFSPLFRKSNDNGSALVAA